MIQANTKRVSFGKRLLTAAASLVMLATCAVTAMPVHAATVAGGTETFNKYLIMDENANVPNVTFTYNVAPGKAVDGNGTDPAIFAGIGAPTIADVTFAAGDSTQTGTPASDNQKYAVKEATIDLSGVSFTAPGIYRYTITETAGNSNGIVNQGNTTRTLDVYVTYTDDSATALEVSGYVLQDGTVAEPTVKSTGFYSLYNTKDLVLSKTVTGDQGDRDKYFEFTVNITGAVAGTQYTVDLSGADDDPTVDGEQKTNAATLTADDGTVRATYYLKHGQSIKVQGLTAETKYTIAETSYVADGYTTENTVDTVKSAEALTTGEQTMGDTGHTVVFTNNKDTGGVVPTGLLLDVAPYIVLVAVVVAGLAALMLSKKRRSR